MTRIKLKCDDAARRLAQVSALETIRIHNVGYHVGSKFLDYVQTFATLLKTALPWIGPRAWFTLRRYEPGRPVPLGFP